ncbi:MAG: hypothetical protein FD165_1900 [Gammaproteobacteria bacterium]|nr:MAG: hypothetical protein FD165_1900 [Gammaproteobacteria bacterium]TND04472.1 MAG: hypothetical protein FD120_1586 [Gammaproteobacteria bacterium]
MDRRNGEKNVNTIKWHFNFNPNLGNVDRFARFLIGTAVIVAFLLAAPEFAGWMVILPLLAIPTIISAIIGWDPAYSLFKSLAFPGIKAKSATAAA